MKIRLNGTERRLGVSRRARRIRMALNRTHYQVLGVTPEASEREIKRAYHRLARQMHPDKAATPEQARRMELDFAAISTAYNALKDKARRREYDEQLKRGEPAEAPAASPPFQAASGAQTGAERGAAEARKVSPDASKDARSAIAKKAFARGMQFHNLGDYAKAVEFLEAAIQNNAAEPLYYARLAKALMNARRSFTRAREAALKAIELDPYNVDYRLTLGEICETAGSRTLAIQAYKDVLRWEADNAKALARLKELEGGQKGSFLRKWLGKIRKR